MSIPDPMQCGCPARFATTASGPYRGPSEDDPTPEDEPVWCSHHTGVVTGGAPGTGRDLPPSLIRTLTEST